jgi:RimJ/RimL family protein N-acetyltransferase
MMDANRGSQPVLNIVGEQVALGPNSRDLMPLYQGWVNDFEVTRTLGLALRPTTRESEEARYKRVAKGSEQEVTLTIYERDALRPIGITRLHDIDLLHRTAEFVMFIGEKDCWGKGYGTEKEAA